MNPWARRHKNMISLIIGTVLLVVLAFILVPYFTTEPTCSDGKRNGDEAGVDCGGSCALYCPFQITMPAPEYSTVTKLADNRYNAVAEVRNPNTMAATRAPVPYRFEVRNADNDVIATREGSMRLGPQERQIAFAHNIAMASNEEPAMTRFSFLEQGDWYVTDGEELALLPVSVVDQRVQLTAGTPRIRATIANRSFASVYDIRVVALVYDTTGNVIASSQTWVGGLGPESSEDVVFTWPQPLPREAGSVEVIPHLDPFRIAS